MRVAGLATIVLAAWFIQASRPDASGPVRRFAVQWLAMPIAIFVGPWLIFRSAFGAMSDGSVLSSLCEGVLMIASGVLASVIDIISS